MANQENVIDCYSRISQPYLEHFKNELKDKLFDRVYLNAFAERNKGKRIIDLGCGPGITSKFLIDQGCRVIGVDIAPGMVDVASHFCKTGTFVTGDMLSLNLADQSFDAAISLYSIIHFDYDNVAKAFSEIFRILKSGSEYLMSFHIGTSAVPVDSILKTPVHLILHLLEVNKIRLLLEQTGFTVVESIERHPYPEIEYQSKRAYILAKK